MMRRVDLLPERYAAAKRERRAIGMVIVAGLVVVGLMLGWWFMLNTQANGVQGDIEDAQARNSALEAQIAELQPFADLEAQIVARRSALTTVMTGDINWPSLLTEIAMVIPGEVWLTSIAGSAGATATASPVGTETAEIRITNRTPVGRIAFQGNALTMPGVARWLIRQATANAFTAVWLNNATGAEIEGEIGEITFDSTLELGRQALSERFLRANP